MSGLFASRGSSGEPWFRLGRLEVGTTMFVVLAIAASWIAWVAAPGLPGALAFSMPAVADGQLWRLVTWPFANGLTLWTVLNLFFFWYFGTELEQMIGRNRMAWLLVGVWGSLTLASALVGLVAGAGAVLAGIGLVQFAILLLWIAEYPNRRFFFGIPAWVIGLVLVGVQAAGMLASRDGAGLLSLLLGFVLIAIVARRQGLLGEYAWLPGARRTRPAGGGGAPRPAAPRVPRAAARAERRQTSSRERLDELLDRINDHGIDSLSASERRELMRLRDQLRGG